MRQGMVGAGVQVNPVLGPANPDVAQVGRHAGGGVIIAQIPRAVVA